MSRRMLVVDDDRQMVRTLCDVLRLRGWETKGATSGEEAIEAVHDGTYEVVLMDIKMEGMNGVEALKRIRRMDPQVHVILMTAFTAAELIEEARRSGAMTVLAKPVAIPNLLETLGRCASARPVLVVDDDPAFLLTLSRVVAEHGHRVLQAAGIDDALQRLEEDSPAVVVLDLRLDHVEPRQGILAIRKVDPTVMLILCSGHPDLLRETSDALPREWIHGKLEKPFPPDHLLEMIDAIGEH